jgi:hypothetical protein
MIALLLIGIPLVGLGLLQLVFMVEERITDESYL